MYKYYEVTTWEEYTAVTATVKENKLTKATALEVLEYDTIVVGVDVVRSITTNMFGSKVRDDYKILKFTPLTRRRNGNI